VELSALSGNVKLIAGILEKSEEGLLSLLSLLLLRLNLLSNPIKDISNHVKD
jgi:hypothetical protein